MKKHEQTLYIRVYNCPQRTDKESLCRVKEIVFGIADRFSVVEGEKQCRWKYTKSFVVSQDEKHGEYLQIRVMRLLKSKKKDIVLWLNYAG